jgi:poly-gamma-glutamate synthesis protein (capsule biosynthesis protein)
VSPSRRVRRRRRQVGVGLVVVLVLIVVLVSIGGGSKPPAHHPSETPSAAPTAKETASPTWKGSGKPVTLAFGGDVHFEAMIGDRLSTDASTALGPGLPTLLSGAEVSMANLDTALTNSPTNCPNPPAGAQYVFHTGPEALTALAAAHLDLMGQANNHALDCGTQGLQLGIAAAANAQYPIIGVGANRGQALSAYRATVHGQRIAVLAATQVLDPALQASSTATDAQPGVVSAFDIDHLVTAVQQARRDADTVVVFLYWGVDSQTCPVTQQSTLARTLIKAGADVVVGSGAHVQQGAGYLGSALVDYGLGNLAFYDTQGPSTSSGTLLVTVTGRHVDHFAWRPAQLQGGIPVPLTGAAATSAQQSWAALRSCAHLTAKRTASLATPATEKSPVPAPVAQVLSQNTAQG